MTNRETLAEAEYRITDDRHGDLIYSSREAAKEGLGPHRNSLSADASESTDSINGGGGRDSRNVICSCQ